MQGKFTSNSVNLGCAYTLEHGDQHDPCQLSRENEEYTFGRHL